MEDGLEDFVSSHFFKSDLYGMAFMATPSTVQHLPSLQSEVLTTSPSQAVSKYTSVPTLRLRSLPRFVDKRLSTYKVLELPSFAARPPPAAAGGETAVGGGADNAAARLFTLAGKVPSHVRFGLDVNAQLGGTYVVQVGGRVVMEHLQAEPGDYLKHDDILRALGIAKEPAA
mmetsp:Transcript_122/g.374  ORF Transcript_122/g.374 Transcript_122/m.374 type:complete len:172 (+) Transcript_122:575-1090(+)